MSTPNPAGQQDAPAQGTLPGLVYQQSLQRPDGVALRKKDFGIWQSTTWAQYFAAIRSRRPGVARARHPRR